MTSIFKTISGYEARIIARIFLFLIFCKILGTGIIIFESPQNFPILMIKVMEITRDGFWNIFKAMPMPQFWTLFLGVVQ